MLRANPTANLDCGNHEPLMRGATNVWIVTYVSFESLNMAVSSEALVLMFSFDAENDDT
mgnify:FL=1